jgi:hypothetical protein
MEIDRNVFRTGSQPGRQQRTEQLIPVRLQGRNLGRNQLCGKIAAHGIGIRCPLQIGTHRFNRGMTRRRRQHDTPHIGGLAAIAGGTEQDMLLSHQHGIMQGLLVGQADRLRSGRFAH